MKTNLFTLGILGRLNPKTSFSFLFLSLFSYPLLRLVPRILNYYLKRICLCQTFYRVRSFLNSAICLRRLTPRGIFLSSTRSYHRLQTIITCDLRLEPSVIFFNLFQLTALSSFLRPSVTSVIPNDGILCYLGNLIQNLSLFGL